MGHSTVFVGLDYHQASVQVCVMDRQGRVLGNRRCPNEVAVIVTAAEQFGSIAEAAIESCTGAAALADALRIRAGWSIHLAHPGYVRRMKQSPDKSDYTDARMLADLVRVGYLPRVWLAPEEVRELRRLVRYRQQLVNDRRNMKLRVRALLRDQRIRGPQGKAWTQRWLRWLREDAALSDQGRWITDRHLIHMEAISRAIADVEARLAQVTSDDSLVAALSRYHGIGPVTAWTLRAEIGRFDRFRSGKQLARFCGLSPRNASSGTRQADAGLIKAGNRQLRATLIEAGHRLVRMDADWQRFADGLLARGKPKCVVIVAAANRWVRRLFHDMQSANLAA